MAGSRRRRGSASRRRVGRSPVRRRRIGSGRRRPHRSAGRGRRRYRAGGKGGRHMRKRGHKRGHKHGHRKGHRRGHKRRAGRGRRRSKSASHPHKRSRSGRRHRRSGSRRRHSRSARAQSSEFVIPMFAPRNLQDVKFHTYIKKVLKKVTPKVGIKTTSVDMVDNLLKDVMHQLATLAASKMGRRKTMKPRVIERALKKVLPKDLVEKASRHAENVLDRYERSLRGRVRSK